MGDCRDSVLGVPWSMGKHRHDHNGPAEPGNKQKNHNNTN
jgi:hypothetical protein